MPHPVRPPGQKIRKRAGLHGGHDAYTLSPRHTDAAIRRSIDAAGCPRLRQMVLPWKRFCGTGGHHRGSILPPKMITVDEFHKFQSDKQVIKRLSVGRSDHRIHRRKGDGCFRADGGQFIGKIGILLPRFQLLPQLGTDGAVLQVGIHTIQTAKPKQQIRGGLGANPCYTRNIIRGISHQRFQIDEFLRLKAVFSPEGLLIIEGSRGLSLLADDQLHIDMLIDQLEGVPVTGHDDAVPVLLTADFTHGTDHIVRFPSLAFVDGDIHGREHLLHHRHLHRQFFRHSMAVGLVSVITQVAESRAVKVECNAHRFGLLFLFHAFENV